MATAFRSFSKKALFNQPEKFRILANKENFGFGFKRFLQAKNVTNDTFISY